jgi:hypothetical protein
VSCTVGLVTVVLKRLKVLSVTVGSQNNIVIVINIKVCIICFKYSVLKVCAHTYTLLRIMRKK